MALNNITKLGWRRVSNLSSDAAFNNTMFDFGIKCLIKSYIQYLLQYTTYVDEIVEIAMEYEFDGPAF